ncbi:hypothetical protein SAMN06265360_108190 [Haloechinothrix alba]|uniref:Uncharacterized protein n=1 Tax=Haloechinothrix alba TaxID=664784 RepID=A0A238X1A4_9PSEU|nr:hypothetical protein [Haloechinothrix alba]SNR52715.1 hypothetical protein SAMN06265360_108190 [Haloechinothrix alba]
MGFSVEPDAVASLSKQVEDFLGRLAAPTAAPTPEALIDAARYYRPTDNASAERLDATYPEHDVTEARRGVEDVTALAGTFEDVADPTGNYQAPKDYHDEFPHEPAWTDSLGTIDRAGGRPGVSAWFADWAVARTATSEQFAVRRGRLAP